MANMKTFAELRAEGRRTRGGGRKSGGRSGSGRGQGGGGGHGGGGRGRGKPRDPALPFAGCGPARTLEAPIASAMRSDAGGRAAAAARHAAFVAAQQDKLEREAAAAAARRPGAASAPIHISDSDGDADDAEVAQGMPAAKRQKRANHPAGGRASGAGPDVDARHQKRPRAAAPPAATHKPTTSAAEYNPWGASGYVPDNPDVRDLQLFTDEWCDVSLSPGEPSLKLRACLDTGNGGPTVISRGAAQRLGMLSDKPLGFVTMRGANSCALHST